MKYKEKQSKTQAQNWWIVGHVETLLGLGYSSSARHGAVCLRKVSSCVASPSTGAWRSVEWVRVTALGGDLLIQVLNAAWHSDSWREMENIHFDAYPVLAQTHSLALFVHSLQENTHVRPQSMHRHCCAILFPPDACCIIIPTRNG